MRNVSSNNRWLALVACLIILSSLLAGVFTNKVFAEGGTATELSSYETRVTDSQGHNLIKAVFPSPPPKVKMAPANVPSSSASPSGYVAGSVNVLSNVPAFYWSYGCSATAAAMLFGYYDRIGYSNMYTGPAGGGVCPMDNSIWGRTAYPSVTCGECPLSATHQGVDGRAIKGHVDDYWIDYGNYGPDPYTDNWTEHATGDCTADFMGTNQVKYRLWDGATYFFWNGNGGDPLYDYTGMESSHYRDGCHGMRLFAESRGYTVTANFSQEIRERLTDKTKGFTFQDYQAEIDAGRPVMIQVEGHSMLGYGYDTSTNTIYIRDTWDYNSHTMIWGGSYSGRQHLAVTVIRLAALAPAPPMLLSPSNGTSAGGTSVFFQWASSSGATRYRLQVNSNSTFTGITMFDSIIAGSSQSVSGFTNTGGTYYWRVYAGNAGDLWSIPSEVRSFVNNNSQRFLGPEDSTATATTSPNYFILDRFTANTTGDITSIRIKCGSNGNVKVAIYADSAGSPGALLNAVNTGTAVTTGWNTISIPSTAVNAGAYYWLSFIMDTSCVSYRQEGNTTRCFKPVAYNGFTFPASAGSGFNTSYTIWYDYITAWGTVTSAPASSKLIGPEDSTATATTSPNYFILDRFAANTTGDITSIRIKCGSNGNVKVAVYADSAGSPGALRSAVNTGTAVTTGWNTISIPSTAVNAGAYYWLSFIMDTSCVSYRQEGNTTRCFKPVAYNGFTFPASAGGGFNTSYTIWYDYITAWGTVTSAPASSKLIGPEDSTATATTSPNYFILDRFAANTTGDITSIRIKCGSNGNVKVAIYADSAGSPGALLNAVNTGTAVTTGWNTISIPSTAVNAGAYYWLSFIMDTSCVSYRQEGNTTRCFKPVAYNGFTFPASAGGGFNTSYTIWYDYITGWGSAD